MAEYRFKSRHNGSSSDSKLSEKSTKRTSPVVALSRLFGRSAAEKTLLRKKEDKVVSNPGRND